ncbi:MAG: DUF3427 domain-containing protein, partial [Nitrososphaerales archaeon]
SHFDHVFASIQSLNLSDIENLDPSRFDVVIVDEFHHAAADSYTKLLEHIQPKELLGLTATPERADGLSILGFFEGRIAAELRLWDAIDQQYLTPFSYFGISDGTDLSHIPWRRGAGYDIDSLTNVYTASSVWSAFVAKEFVAHIDDLDSVKALGFCVSIRHAEYMAQIFSARGIRAVCVSSQTEQTQRENALQELESGDIKVVFSVDIFNEGVDVPSVNTILLLRPTESATIFLQQIGRGLRKSRDKGSCLVLDFVGNQNAEFRFDLKFRALVGGSRKNLTHQIENGFPYLPSGCSLDLDQKSASVILASIRNALPSRISELVKEYHALLEVRPNPSLGEFLDYTGLALSDIYSNDRCWSDIVLAGGGVVEESGPEAKYLRKVAGRFTHLDDLGRLNFYSSLIRERKRQFKDDTVEFRFARMLIAQIFSSPIAMKSLPKDASIPDALEFLFQHKQVCRELLELFDVLKGSINHLGYPIRNRPVNPLQIHARYTRREILAAFGCGKDVLVPEWREGVKDVPNERADLFAFTFDKSSAGFSDSTRYKDYAISQDLIHWESQSTTRADGPVGMRYQNHVALGRDIFLFCRLTTDDRAFWFLGPATYLSHQGDRPMAVKWQLGTPLPGDLYTQFAAAVA